MSHYGFGDLDPTTFGEDRLWWGKAIPKEGTESREFHVDRYADFARASTATAMDQVMIPPRAAGPGLPGTITQSLCFSDDMGQTWYFADLGWVVPT